MPSTSYLQILSLSSPSDIGTDPQNRVTFVCNFIAKSIGLVARLEKEIAKLISDASLGTLGTSMFYGSRAVIPTGASALGPYILIKRTGGLPPDEDHNGTIMENPSFQVTVYAANIDTGQERMDAIWRLLDGQRSITVTTV